MTNNSKKFPLTIGAIVALTILISIFVSCQKEPEKPNYNVLETGEDGKVKKVDYTESVEEILKANE